MRRMYSEQELSKIIKEVFDAEVASGEFDETIADYVDAYLVEHPVDITALEGQDVELASLDASGLITGAEILEKMNGYSFTPSEKTNITMENIYTSVSKTGNKITFVVFVKLNRSGEVAGSYVSLGAFTIPNSINNKLYPYTLSGDDRVLDAKVIPAWSSKATKVDLKAFLEKNPYSPTPYIELHDINSLTLDTNYFIRYEVTLLLSDNMTPTE